jgi:hypothetical protein
MIDTTANSQRILRLTYCICLRIMRYPSTQYFRIPCVCSLSAVASQNRCERQSGPTDMRIEMDYTDGPPVIVGGS